MTIRQLDRVHVAVVVAVAAGVTLTGCGSNDNNGAATVSGPVVIDGSSTVEPLSTAAAGLFMAEHPDTNVTVGTSGTGGGFAKFCAGETDISDASRPIEGDEIAACEAKGIAFSQLTVANDALSVVVNPDNDWADCLTVAQLNRIWAPGSTVTHWNQVDPSFPNEPLSLFGAGTASGTFDYFTQAVNGQEGASRTDYAATEDDNVTVAGVAGAKGALGYFGYSYVEANPDKVRAVKIDGGGGCVAPSAESARDGRYTPLTRELFIYVSDVALTKPQVVSFADFYLRSNTKIVEKAGFIPLTDDQLKTALTELDELNQKVTN
ncbi:PstS family phosphate ABC transporter substrate-binding protein [Rhodococcus sp. T2V]|uniref:PstS family phosphate ABC transporter substrate-binding protein n=1 Tax=Rhodococcus sp. T2V TaxID=3034164 RepID=UPI0023E101AA|nr:PstS family phosphate ABC transporter substrate-binding protein [Rhodococcus sp. T2V]MDF3312286.1 PstS family phosphate ABC transporter substrate-binding protein [Rhodococcus sp. T2V]